MGAVTRLAHGKGKERSLIKTIVRPMKSVTTSQFVFNIKLVCESASGDVPLFSCGQS